MMSFDDHVAALRAAADGDDAALAHETRLRLRRSLDADRAPVMRWPGVVAAFAVLLVATASWALATGQVQKLWERTEPVIEEPARLVPYSATEPVKAAPVVEDRQITRLAPAHARHADEAEASAKTDVAVLDAVGAPSPSKSTPTPTPTEPWSREREATGARFTGTSIGEAPMSAPPRSTIEHAPVETLYRAAHELHFHGNDPAAALAAWDRYLAAEPTGRFAVEARYNRALCLVRLGRLVDARAALVPFADGDVEPANYRQDEAKALVERIDHARKPD